MRNRTDSSLLTCAGRERSGTGAPQTERMGESVKLRRNLCADARFLAAAQERMSFEDAWMWWIECVVVGFAAFSVRAVV